VPFFVFDKEAGVFDDDEACGAGLFRGGRVGNSLLEPEDSGANGDGRIGDGRNVFGAAEDIDDVDRLRNVLEAGVGFLAEDLGFVGIDRDDFVADGLKIGSDFMGWAAGIGRKTDDGNGFGFPKDLSYRVGGKRGVVRQVKQHHCV